MAGRRRSARSGTGTRTALARHVGPPRAVRPAADPRPDRQPDPRSERSDRQRRSVLGAVAGAALAVCGVGLGISALLWAQPPPPGPPGPAGISAGDQDAGAGATLAPTRPSGQPSLEPASSPSVAPSMAPSLASPPSPAPSPSPTAEPTLAPVTVLNNSRIPGLAARWAARFEAAGWPVAATGNYRGRLTATTVFHDPGQEQTAGAFAARFPGVERVQLRTATLPGRGLTVVLTRDVG